MKIEANAVGFMQAATGRPLPGIESLDYLRPVPDSVRGDVAVIRCNEAALSTKELRDAQALELRALKWAADEQEALGAEDVKGQDGA